MTQKKRWLAEPLEFARRESGERTRRCRYRSDRHFLISFLQGLFVTGFHTIQTILLMLCLSLLWACDSSERPSAPAKAPDTHMARAARVGPASPTPENQAPTKILAQPTGEQPASAGTSPHERAPNTSRAQDTSNPPQSPEEALIANEMSAYRQAKPVFHRYCAPCHTSDGPRDEREDALGHFVMDGYPFGGHHAHEIAITIRQSLGASGKDSTMPQDAPGSVQGDELALILAWADAFSEAQTARAGHHARTKHHHHKKQKKRPKRHLRKHDGHHH